MRVSILGSVLAAAASVRAFADSSPFFLVSTVEFPPAAAGQLQSAAAVSAKAHDVLAACATDHYYILAQPGAHASDLSAPPACDAPRLRRLLARPAFRSRFAVAEVLPAAGASDGRPANETLLDGDDAAAALARHIERSCAAQGRAATVQTFVRPPLPAVHHCAERAELMGDNDHILGNLVEDALAQLAPADEYTVVFVAGAAPAAAAVATDAAHGAQAPVHRRRLVVEARDGAGGAARDTRGLFEKYQFFTPGIFMSLVVFAVLLSMLYVALTALASLQVSYGAFDREMGPAAQKKQQ